MVSHEGYRRVVESVLGELSALCAAMTGEEFRSFRGMSEECAAVCGLMSDPALPDVVLIATAAGLVDEGMARAGESTMSDGYHFFFSRLSESELTP